MTNDKMCREVYDSVEVICENDNKMILSIDKTKLDKIIKSYGNNHTIRCTIDYTISSILTNSLVKMMKDEASE